MLHAQHYESEAYNGLPAHQSGPGLLLFPLRHATYLSFISFRVYSAFPRLFPLILYPTPCPRQSDLARPSTRLG